MKFFRMIIIAIIAVVTIVPTVSASEISIASYFQIGSSIQKYDDPPAEGDFSFAETKYIDCGKNAPFPLPVASLSRVIVLILKLLVPIIIIVMGSLDFVKAVAANKEDDIAKGRKKFIRRLTAGLFAFMVISIVQFVISIVAGNGKDPTLIKCLDCIISKADSCVETSFPFKYVPLPPKYSNKKIGGGGGISITSNKSQGSTTGSGTATIEGTYSTGGGAAGTAGTVYSNEPDPSSPINYNANMKLLNKNEFLYPKDSRTGKALGAWPKNYQSVPANVGIAKTYNNGTLIMPVTPSSGKYGYVYEHYGIDIMATFGTPIYSPVDGTLNYSEWGHTVNKGVDETAYTVSITPNSLTSAGSKVDSVFLTHMCGIIYRCNSVSDCKNVANGGTVKKGELLGFVGNASGGAKDTGWAPHLHMSFCVQGKCSAPPAVRTAQIEATYGLKSGQSIKAGG